MSLAPPMPLAAGNSHPAVPSLSKSDQIRLVVIAPTYNNAPTLLPVLTAILDLGLPIIIVDDGSTDETAELLANWHPAHGAVRTITLHKNYGKAAALQAGFQTARAQGNSLSDYPGFTHALTIDTDGQHDPADIPALLAEAQRDPTALILGTRDASDPAYPRLSRLGRWSSNVLISFHSGLKVADSQCGLRIYPLAALPHLTTRASHYGFETEILVRAAFANLPIRHVPIRCIYQLPHERISHFRPWRDSFRAFAMHFRLMCRSLTPVPPAQLFPTRDATTTGTLFQRACRATNPLRTWRLLRVDPAERDRLSASLAWGAFMAFQPYFGIKTILCLALSKIFRLQPLVVIATSSLTSPPIGIAAWTISIVVGHYLLHGQPPDLDHYSFSQGPLEVFRHLALEWCLGGLVLGIVAALTIHLLAHRLIRRIPLAPSQA